MFEHIIERKVNVSYKPHKDNSKESFVVTIPKEARELLQKLFPSDWNIKRLRQSQSLVCQINKDNGKLIFVPVSLLEKNDPFYKVGKNNYRINKSYNEIKNYAGGAYHTRLLKDEFSLLPSSTEEEKRQSLFRLKDERDGFIWELKELKRENRKNLKQQEKVTDLLKHVKELIEGRENKTSKI